MDGCHDPHEPVDWCADASLATGLTISHTERRSGGLLVLAVDDTCYAISFGTHGRQLLADEHKDPRFGLQFAVRAVDPYRVHGLVRRFPAARGRSDLTFVPAGLPIFSFGIEPAEIVRRLGGALDQVSLTFGGHGRRTARVEGSAGLRVRLALSADELVADIRAIAQVCASGFPHDLLEFVDNLQPVGDPATAAQLAAVLENMLLDAGEHRLAPAVPTSCLAHLGDTGSYQIKIPGTRAHARDHLDLDAILTPLRRHPAGDRVSALRKGTIQVCATADGKQPLAGAMALRWLEADCAIGARRFHLLDGHWYEIGATYLDGIRAHVARILGTPPSLDLPPWPAGWEEKDYKRAVPDMRDGYVCLDRKGVRNPLDITNSIEVCDLLGPDDELIHVKKTAGSSPLSHLFYQALVSTQALAFSREVRTQFASLVRKHAPGRNVPLDFQPKKVVLAILLRGGAAITGDSLFPFSQITLAHTAITLQEQHHIDLEIVAIPGASS
ncbi:TIGR04141 family sporadically distributed protein [Nonomuraea sp. NBC_01738]|nr:TIGR04141 family sporadically distributed protein [Nonomuraea sp. NBC_01738]